jgi:phospholipid transport system transporter-binding protein
LNAQARPTAAFEVRQGEHARVIGSLLFTTVIALLPVGVEAIAGGHATVVDLKGVVASDSSGLALLIEWLSAAKNANRTLRYENVPVQVQQLARLSEVEELLIATSLKPTRTAVEQSWLGPGAPDGQL